MNYFNVIYSAIICITALKQLRLTFVGMLTLLTSEADCYVKKLYCFTLTLT